MKAKHWGISALICALFIMFSGQLIQTEEYALTGILGLCIGLLGISVSYILAIFSWVTEKK